MSVNFWIYYSNKINSLLLKITVFHYFFVKQIIDSEKIQITNTCKYLSEKNTNFYLKKINTSYKCYFENWTISNQYQTENVEYNCESAVIDSCHFKIDFYQNLELIFEQSAILLTPITLKNLVYFNQYTAKRYENHSKKNIPVILYFFNMTLYT